MYDYLHGVPSELNFSYTHSILDRFSGIGAKYLIKTPHSKEGKKNSDIKKASHQLEIGGALFI